MPEKLDHLVTLFPSKFIKKDDVEGEQIPFKDLLITTYKEDRHFLPYVSGTNKRLGVSGFHKKTTSATANVVVIDVDCPEVHRGDLETVTSDWILTEKQKLTRLSEILPYTFYVTFTSGGYKIFFPILPFDMMQGTYRDRYSSLCAFIYAEADILADAQCCQETRMFRAPNVKRGDGKRDPNEPLMSFIGEILDLSTVEAEPDWVDSLSESSKEWGSFFAKKHTNLVAQANSVLEGDDQYRSNVTQALEWIRRQPPAMQGLSGDKDTYDIVRKTLRGFDLSERETMFVLQKGFNPRCMPPWDEADLSYKISNASSSALYPQLGSKLNNIIERADQPGLAEWFIESLVTSDVDMRPVAPVFSDGKVYRPCAETNVWGEMVKPEMSSFIQRRLKKMFRVDKEGELKPVLFSKNAVDGIMSLARDLIYTPGFFSDVPPGTAFQDTFVSFGPQGPKQEPLKASHRIRHSFGFAWPQKRQTKRIENYFRTLCPDHPEDFMEVVLTYIGLCMMGKGTWAQLALVLEGKGSNGKSKLMEILSKLFPTDSVSAISLHDFADEKYRFQLVGKLLNLCPELSHRDLRDTSMLKAIISGDEVNARRLYQDGFRMSSIAGHIISTNLPPATPDVSEGFRRRFLVLPMTAVFVKGKSNSDALDWILSDGIPYLAREALTRAHASLEQGYFPKPEWAVKATQDWLTQMDSVGAFVTEENLETTTSREEWLPSGALYDAYKYFCEDNGYKAVNSRNFKVRLESHGIKWSKLRKGNFYNVKRVDKG